MNTYRIIRDGLDPLTRPALDYVTALGVPATDIKSIRLDSAVGTVQTITVTLLVRSDMPTDGGCE